MNVRAPDFWRAGTRSPWPALLAPVTVLWDAAGQVRRAMAKPVAAGVPVICVGNIVAGGAGKTPTAIAVGKRLQAAGRRVHFLSRGYGGRLRGPLAVDPRRHGAAEVGDEALLLAAVAPTWIARDRGQAALGAVEAGADVLVLDDGHQYPGLIKDLSLVVVDQGYGFGNGRIIPAGPLRESVSAGLARASAVVLIGNGEAVIEAGELMAAPVLTGRYRPGEAADRLSGKRVVAFAGIARPEKFFTMLESIGCRVAARVPFADHHPFNPDEIMRIVEAASAMDAVPVTTEKDFQRLPADARLMVQTLPISLELDEPARMDELLATVAG